MRWHDFDRNGRVDGRDYFIMNELLKEEEEKKEREENLWGEEEGENTEDELW